MRRFGVLAACVALVVSSSLYSAAAGRGLRKVEGEDLGEVSANAVVVSPDGKQVYTVAGATGGDASYVQAFARASDGSVAPIDSEAFGADVVPLFSWIAVPQDGRHVYASVDSDYLAT